jgi:hypothetical protein
MVLSDILSRHLFKVTEKYHENFQSVGFPADIRNMHLQCFLNFLYTANTPLFILYYVTNHDMFRPLWVIIMCHLLHIHNYHTGISTIR